MDHSHHGHHMMAKMPTMMPMTNCTDMPMPMNCSAMMDCCGGMGGGGDMGGMQMFFYFGYQSIILFEGWGATTVGAMIGSCIGIFFIAIIYEGLKYFREYLFKRSFAKVNYTSVTVPGEGPKVSTKARQSIRSRVLSSDHFIQTCLHIVQVAISYFLMLIFMTYNAYLCIAVILGAGVGYFIFGWKKSIVVDVTEHCH